MCSSYDLIIYTVGVMEYKLTLDSLKTELMSNRLAKTLYKNAVSVTLALLSIIILWQGLNIISIFTAPQTDSNIIVPVSSQNTHTDFNDIVNSAIFGNYDPSTYVEQPAPLVTEFESIEETALNLALAGVIANGNDDESASLALIALNNEQPVFYNIGDFILPSVQVINIQNEEIIILNQDQHERLSLARELLEFN